MVDFRTIDRVKPNSPPSQNPLSTGEKENPPPKSFSLKRRVLICQMVEAAGIEPASENNQQWLLHTYPEI